MTRKTTEFGDELTDRERRVAELLALGWSADLIGKAISTPEKRIATHTVDNGISWTITKLGLSGRIGLALWAVDNVLDPAERVEWATIARSYSAAISMLEVLDDPRHRQLLRHLANPATCDLSDVALGELCEPRLPISRVRTILGGCEANIGPHACKLKLAVVLYLAPLAEWHDDESDDETEGSP